MATHRKKVVEVNARKWAGPATMAVYHKVKGDQSAKKGDWLVGPDDAEHGDIEVIKDEDFQRDYEPIEPEIDDSETPVADPSPAEEPAAHLGNADSELPVETDPTPEPAQE